MPEQTLYYPLSLPHAGRVSIDENASTAVFTNVALSGLPLAGGVIWLVEDDADLKPVGLIADPVGDEYDNLELPLAAPWNGDPISGAKFIISYGAGAHDIVQVASAVARFRNLLQNGAGLTFNKNDIADDTLVPNGSIRWNEETQQFEQKVAGTWTVRAISRLGTGRGRWEGPLPKHALSISTGDVAVDFDDGPYFKLVFDDDFELQLPTNVSQGDAFEIVFDADGAGHTPTFASGFAGTAASAIATEVGARTRFRFVVTAETGGTATGVSATKVTFLENDIVEDSGFLFISNADDNGVAPAFIDPATPDSNDYWTWLPLPAGAAGAAVVTGTSTSSVAIGTGPKTFQIVEIDPVRGWTYGTRLRAASGANWMEGNITSFDGEELVLDVDLVLGSGTHSDWSFGLAGEKGDQGDAATVAIGTVTTVAPGDPATVTNVGTANEAVFNIEIPQGSQGIQGNAFAPDEVVATFADRDAFDDEPKNFAVLVEEDESKDGQAYLYFKLSNASADWSNGFLFASGGGGSGSGLLKCRTVAITNIAISTALEAGDVVNGVTLVADDVVLLTAQTDQEENGPYVVSASGAASRHPDYAEFDAVAGSYFAVMEGTVRADTLWRCTSNFGGTLDTDPLVFEEVNGNTDDYGLITGAISGGDDYGSIA